MRVVKEELEKNPDRYDKCYSENYKGHPEIGQTIISNFLGGPWTREYQINLIAEALAQPWETVRVVKEEIEKGGRNKCYDLKFSSTGEIGQSTISEYLGGPWLRKYQINFPAWPRRPFFGRDVSKMGRSTPFRPVFLESVVGTQIVPHFLIVDLR